MAPAAAAFAALLLAAAARGEPPGPPPGIVTYTSLDLALCAPGDRLPAYEPGVAGPAACYEPVGWFPRTCRCLRADCGGTEAERNACAACGRGFAVYASLKECLAAGSQRPLDLAPPGVPPRDEGPGEATARCSDIAPTRLEACPALAARGRCSAHFLRAGGFCDYSCGRCAGAELAATSAAAAGAAGGAAGGESCTLDLPPVDPLAAAAAPDVQAAAASCYVPPTVAVTDTRTGCPHRAAGLKYWDDPATWGGAVPPADGSVAVITLPAASQVLLAGCMLPATARFVQIVVLAGSELILADTALAFTLSSLLVRGALRAGAPTCRLDAVITLTFAPHAAVPQPEFGLLELGGALELHGKLFSPTWTRLSATAARGATRITLKQAVNWELGQSVALATSIYLDLSQNQNEVRTITAISSDRRTLTLNASLAFAHYGGAEYQSEVALLSRSLRLVGAASTEAARLGPQLRVTTFGRLAGVQSLRFGQRNVPGAYPFHFHLIGDGSGQYVTDSAVFSSFYRCYVIHATSHVRLENNVGFSVDGSCFYLEDGVEERNQITGNFAGLMRPIGTPAGGSNQAGVTVEESADVAQPADSNAAGYYLTNPNNDLVGNAASGGAIGFTTVVLQKPIGMSRDVAIVPAARPWGAFRGNTAHSSGYFAYQTAGCIYFGGQLSEREVAGFGFRLTYSSGRYAFAPVDAAGAPLTPLVDDNTVWLCNKGMLFWGQRLDVYGFRAWQTVRALTLVSKSFIKNLQSSATAANTGAPAFLATAADRNNFEAQAGFEWYDTQTQTIIKDSVFSNWRYSTALSAAKRPRVYTGIVYSDQYKPEGMSVTRNVTYRTTDTNALVLYDVLETGASRMFNWIDTDGTSLLRTVPSIYGAYPRWWNLNGSCSYADTSPPWKVWRCASRADQTVGRLDVRVPGYTYERDNAVIPPTPANYMGYVAQFGRDAAGNLLSMTTTRNEGVTGVTGPTGWYMNFTRGAPLEAQLWLTQVPVNFYVLYASRYPPGTTFTIRRIFKFYPDLDRAVAPAASIAEVVNDAAGLKYYFTGSVLYLKLVDPQAVPEYNLEREGVVVYGTRFFNLHYRVQAANADGALLDAAGLFFRLPTPDPGPPAKVAPPVAAAAAAAEVVPAVGPEARQCDDVAPFGTTCAALVERGLCESAYLAAGFWCGASCGRCALGVAG